MAERVKITKQDDSFVEAIIENSSPDTAIPDNNTPSPGKGNSELGQHIATDSGDDKILRFLKIERWLHWSISIPFLTCLITGGVLKFYFTIDEKELLSRVILMRTHQISGICLISLPLLAILFNYKEFKILFYNIKVACTWTLQDIKWLSLMGIAAINKKIKLPDSPKFNSAEKLNFLMVMCTWPLFAATGLILWIQDNPMLYWYIHFSLALLSVPFVAGHMFMALINPDTRVGLSGMISGYVSRHWAEHHYTSWYHERYGTTGRQSSNQS